MHNLQIIKPYAIDLWSLLKPLCKRIKIAGSIRREKEECKDIEIVCVAISYKLEEFLLSQKRSGNIIYTKNGPKMKSFKWRGMQVDLFIANENNFGWILFLRTGPAEWNIKFMQQIKRAGYICENGTVRKNGEAVPLKSESEVFQLINRKFVEPRGRY